MTIPTEPAVHAIAKAFWVDSGRNPNSWVYTPPEDLAVFFRWAQIAYDTAVPFIQAQALEEAVEAFPLETITAPDNAVVWLRRRADEIREGGINDV